MNPDRVSRDPRLPWRFSLRSMLVFMLCASLLFALMKWWGIGAFLGAVIFASPLLLCLRRPRPELAMMKCLIVYLAICMLTLPFMDSLWLGELPPLAVIPWPKLAVAHWVQDIMMASMRPLGLSSGTASPDMIATRIPALAVTYAAALGIFLVVVWYRTAMARPYVWWAIALVVFAIADFLMVLALAGGPGLTIY